MVINAEHLRPTQDMEEIEELLRLGKSFAASGEAEKAMHYLNLTRAKLKEITQEKEAFNHQFLRLKWRIYELNGLLVSADQAAVALLQLENSVTNQKRYVDLLLKMDRGKEAVIFLENLKADEAWIQAKKLLMNQRRADPSAVFESKVFERIMYHIRAKQGNQANVFLSCKAAAARISDLYQLFIKREEAFILIQIFQSQSIIIDTTIRNASKFPFFLKHLKSPWIKHLTVIGLDAECRPECELEEIETLVLKPKRRSIKVKFRGVKKLIFDNRERKYIYLNANYDCIESLTIDSIETVGEAYLGSRFPKLKHLRIDKISEGDLNRLLVDRKVKIASTVKYLSVAEGVWKEYFDTFNRSGIFQQLHTLQVTNVTQLTMVDLQSKLNRNYNKKKIRPSIRRILLQKQ